MAAILPRKLSASLDHLAARVRTIRTLRALSWAGILVPLAALACIVADAYFGLPAAARIPLLVGWIVLTLWQLRRVWRSYVAPVNMEEVACAVEMEYPRLAERLTTAVELSEHADASNGSPELVEEVIRDADSRARKLDLDAAFPRGSSIGSFLFALVLLAVVLTPVFTSPQAGQYVRRFFGAFYNPSPTVNYQVILTSGNEAIKRGDPITLTAYVKETKEGAVLPTSAALVVIVNGKEERLAMTVDNEGFWSARRPAVDTDFDYRVEAGLAVSETKHVLTVAPVLLSSARVQVKPPAYANEGREQSPPIEGLGELAALEHSTITFQLQFQPKPVSAVLVFTAESNPDKSKPERTRYPLKIAADGSTTLTVPATLSGTFKLTAEAEHKVTTEFPPQPLQVQKDEAPKFPRVVGLTDKMREVRPTEQLTIDCTVQDDVAIDKLVLQFRLNNGPIEMIPLDAPRLKSALVDGRITIVLKDKLKAMDAKTGDVIACRLAATDNCNVPEVNLKPHTSYFPEKEVWSEFRINPTAEALAEQDILAKKREIAAKLQEIRDDLKAEARATDRLKSDTQNRRTLTPKDQDELKTLRREVADTGNKIEDLARDTNSTPELKRLADAIRELADREVQDAEQALTKARDEATLNTRNEDFKKANDELNKALKKVDGLLEENEKAAKDRLDQLKLQDLAREQQDLADAAKKAEPKDAAELAKKQKDLDNRLKELQEQSDALKRATDAITAEEAKRLAEEAKRLAEEMQALNKAIDKNNKNDLENRLAELKKKQDELAKKVRELANKTDTATRVSQTPPLQPDDAEAAKNALDKGNPDVAAKEQEKARQELERLARDLERAAAESRDPRAAALQLARLQEEIRQQLAQATEKTPLDMLPADKRKVLEKQQEALERAIKQLKTPNSDGAVVGKQVAAADAAKAKELLEKGAQAGADTKMKETKESLEKLAAKMPTKDQRTAKAKDDLAKLAKQQEELRQQAEQAVKNADKTDPDSLTSRKELAKKLSDAAKQQAALADKLNELDAPGQENRRDKVADAMQKAATDMSAGRPQDIAAAQQGVKREMERLEQALTGQTPADDKVAELAKKQRALAEEATKNAQGLDRTTQAELAKRQGEIARELDKLQTPEAATAQADAADAAKKAEVAGRDGSKPDELAKKTKQAADKLDKLNERVNGKEPAADTADRLAKKQKENATEQDKRKDNASTGEARKKAAQEAEELKNMRVGADAQKAKQQAQEALQRAQNTLDPVANAQAQKDAAKALEQLAEQLSREQKAQAPPESQDPAEEADRLSKKQKESADALQKANEEAKKQGGDAGKQAAKEAMQKAAQEQRDLAKGAEQIPGHDAPKERQQAQEAMRKAQEELDRENFEGAQKMQREAADALDRLSRETKQKQQQRADDSPNLPNQKLADEARHLAEEQRKLRDEAMKAADELAKENNPPKDNTVEELAKQQQQVAQQAAELAKTVGDRQGEKSEQTKQARQAADAAKQTSNQVRDGELEQAKESGKQTEQALDQMAKATPGTDSGKKAQDLARQQSDINKKLEELAGNGQAAKGQQQARQQQLENQARDVGKKLSDIARDSGMSPEKGNTPGSEKAKAAAESAMESGNKMEDARKASQKGQGQQAGQAREQAAEAMQRASQQAGEAAKQLGNEKGSGSPQAGKALQQAQDNMDKAGQQLGQKQPGEASGAMEKAAQQLQKASDKLQQGPGDGDQQGQPKPGQEPGGMNPGGNVGGPGGKLDLSHFSPDVAKHAGKKWGELPGEIQTKIIQEMKARYGEDYARNIKLYFEQLAERK